MSRAALQVGDVRGMQRAFSAQLLTGESEFARRAKRAAGERMQAKLDAVGEEAVRNAEDYIANHYQRREGDRRSIGGRHLEGSMKYRIEGSRTDAGYSGFPAKVILYSLADDKKVAILNYGAPPHEIRPRPGTPFLRFPRSGSGASFSSTRVRQGMHPFGSATRVAPHSRFIPSSFGGKQASGGSTVRASKVNHPGVLPSYFMELALEAATRETLRRAVKLRRGKSRGG